MAGGRVLGDVGAQHLDGDGAAAGVQTEVHDAHPAGTDALDEPVRAESLDVGGPGDGVPPVVLHAAHGT
ncbi:hypothetical protein GCM10027194_31500 [Thalassiella azotivora]